LQDTRGSDLLAALHHGTTSGLLYDRAPELRTLVPDVGIVPRKFNVSELLNDMGFELSEAAITARGGAVEGSPLMQPGLNLKNLAEITIGIQDSPYDTRRSHRSSDPGPGMAALLGSSSADAGVRHATFTTAGHGGSAAGSQTGSQAGSAAGSKAGSKPGSGVGSIAGSRAPSSSSLASSLFDAKPDVPAVNIKEEPKEALSIGMDSIAEILSKVCLVASAGSHPSKYPGSPSSVTCSCVFPAVGSSGLLTAFGSCDASVLVHEKISLYDSIFDSRRMRLSLAASKAATTPTDYDTGATGKPLVCADTLKQTCPHCYALATQLAAAAEVASTKSEGLLSSIAPAAQMALETIDTARQAKETSSRRIETEVSYPEGENTSVTANKDNEKSKHSSAKVDPTTQTERNLDGFAPIGTAPCRCWHSTLNNAADLNLSSSGKAVADRAVIGLTHRHGSLCPQCSCVAAQTGPAAGTGFLQMPLSNETLAAYVRVDLSLLADNISLHSSTLEKLLRMRHEMHGYDMAHVHDDIVTAEDGALKAFPKLSEEQVQTMRGIAKLLISLPK
jgi:hypothetical protein